MAVIAASQPMLAIAVPSLTLVPVMMNRLVKSSRCSQQPQPIRTLVPASSGRIPLAQARRAGSRRAVDGGHEIQPSSPSHHWQAELTLWGPGVRPDPLPCSAR
jgi:hypothetical protein